MNCYYDITGKYICLKTKEYFTNETDPSTNIPQELSNNSTNTPQELNIIQITPPTLVDSQPINTQPYPVVSQPNPIDLSQTNIPPANLLDPTTVTSQSIPVAQIYNTLIYLVKNNKISSEQAQDILSNLNILNINS
jgi:hypothetical protein